MKCVICKTGETAPSETTVTLEKSGKIVVFRGVPAEVCTTCGEAYVSELTTRVLYDSMNNGIASSETLSLQDFETVRA
jgi:YgiT-type zinc finger domain-containing protein